MTKPYTCGVLHTIACRQLELAVGGTVALTTNLRVELNMELESSQVPKF